MNPQEIMAYYSRIDVQKAILNFAKSREVAGVYSGGGYSKRPNTLVHSSDIIAMAKAGAIEFHCSLEHWSNPMNIREGFYNDNRSGWDLILDIDCDFFEHGKIGAKVLSAFLEKNGLKTYSIKFTGGKGFHLGIGWKSLPKEIDYRETRLLFPDVARSVAAYIKHSMKRDLAREFSRSFSPEQLAEQMKIPLGNLLTDDGIDPYQIIEIDPILLSPRHLFRMPFSLNMSTFFVSMPLAKGLLDSFKREDAAPEKIKTSFGFLQDAEENEAEFLVSEALDFVNKNKSLAKPQEAKKPMREIKDAVSADLFPPCIKAISTGLLDGKKRAVFILINFLSSLKWKYSDIEKYLSEWNSRNTPPLPENYIRAQLKWFESRGKSMPPPNCPSPEKTNWYQDIGVCKPDQICGLNKIILKNPLNYPFKLLKTYKPQIKETKQRKRKFSKPKQIGWDDVHNL